MTVKSNSKYPYCDGNFPSYIQRGMAKLSNEQTTSLYAMQNLLCSYTSIYGIGEKFCLQMKLESNCEYVTIEEIIGQGGSKKAVLFTDGRVAMLPNMDVDNFIGIAQWWPENVKNEVSMAVFLENIGVPALNRKEAFLTIPNKNDENASYKLPIFLSDSFEQYASRGWFVYDCKYRPSTIRSDKEKWSFEVNSWKQVITPLLIDTWKLVSNNIIPSRDSMNLVLVNTEQDSFVLRYFGFDFGGKHASQVAPPLENAVTTIEWDSNKCDRVAKLTKIMLAGFIQDRLKRLKNYDEVDNFIDKIEEHFLNCEFLKAEISNIQNSYHDDI